MPTFYNSLAAEFEQRIADLRPTDAYSTLRQTALKFAKGGLEIIEQLGIPVNVNTGKRKSGLVNKLERAYSLYTSGALQDALELALRAGSEAEDEMDLLSEIDALHLIGRIHFDVDRFSAAEQCFADEMDMSLCLSLVPAFFRAVHETARVQARRYDLLKAEFGFRLAWDYYTCRMVVVGPSKLSNAPGSDWQNSNAAIGCLRALSQTYFLFQAGPTEAMALVDRLASPHFSDLDGSGEAFLEARGLATACISSIPEHRGTLARMGSRAMALHRKYPKMSSFILEEAEYVASLHDDAFPSTLRRVLSKSSEPRELRSASFYKPSAVASASVLSERPFATPASAAKNASALYRYLKDSDGQGRYVYRGQTAYYSGPLLPSAFRPILTEEHGRTTKSTADDLYHRFSLRKSGKLFYGEYNTCFDQYANPVRHLADASSDKRNAALVLYKRILDDPTIALSQEGAKYVSWIEALRSVLSAEDYDLFSENRRHWMLRINNYHRRQYRMERFIALFGYTLGTTIAQQYGLSSEALDATKNIDVAFFFATHDSSDFKFLLKDGIGVIYRFPFPQNDIASVPVDKYDYYTLPSVIDVKDVIYRFEVKGLDRKESRTCIDAYVGASMIDHFIDPDLLILPGGFYGTTRVSKQDAVIILPDEIREDHLEREPGIGGIRFPKYRYIEDLGAREGVEQFYFIHTGEVPPEAARIRREELWPRDDFLLEVVARIVLGTNRVRKIIPKRPDLIDVGFDNDEFARECSDRYWADRPTFFTEYEKIGAQFGALTL